MEKLVALVRKFTPDADKDDLESGMETALAEAEEGDGGGR